MAQALRYSPQAAAPVLTPSPQALRTPGRSDAGHVSQATPRARLVRQDNVVLPLNSDNVSLGRQVLNPNDGLLSRNHASIYHQGHHYWLADSGSRNGTYLNGQRVYEPAMLQNGDRIQLGQTMLRFEELG
jgi:pSer/pThr/pTyr-binding forkhead associated (FHA) protein